MQETQVRPLGWEDPLEKEMVTHSSILAWRTPWTKKTDRLQSMGSKRVEQGLATKQGFPVPQRLKRLPPMQETRVRSLGQEAPGEGNGNPLQYSCLENPMDGEG